MKTTVIALFLVGLAPQLQATPLKGLAFRKAVDRAVYDILPGGSNVKLTGFRWQSVESSKPNQKDRDLVPATLRSSYDKLVRTGYRPSTLWTGKVAGERVYVFETPNYEGDDIRNAYHQAGERMMRVRPMWEKGVR